MNARRVLYLQYADPAAYPPIEHSSKILADRGWEVVLLGTHAFGDHNFSLPPHPRIRAKNLRSRGNQGIEYFFYFIWSLYWVWRWRPKWIYASDPLVLPTIWMLRKLSRARLLYHEHDSPNRDRANSWFMRLVLGCRRMLGSDAELCIIPQQERL